MDVTPRFNFPFVSTAPGEAFDPNTWTSALAQRVEDVLGPFMDAFQGDTDGITFTPTAGANMDVSAAVATYRLMFGSRLAFVTCNNIRTGATSPFNIPTNGNVTNTVVCVLPPILWPPSSMGLYGFTGGRVMSLYVDSTGNVRISAIAPDATQTASVAVPANEEISFTGVIPLAKPVSLG